MKKNCLLRIILLTFTLTGSLQAQFVPHGINIHYDVAQMGMGGIATTISTNAHAIIYNPGLISRREFAVELSLPAGANLDIIDLTDLVQKYTEYGEDGINVFSDFSVLGTEEAQEEFIRDSQPLDNKWISMNSSPYIGLVYKNFGVAIYQTISTGIKLDQGVLVPALGVRAYSDLVVAYGFGKTVELAKREVGLGFAIRTYQRQVLPTERVSALDVAKIEELSETVIEELPDPVSGFSLDVGGIHTFNFDGSYIRNSLDVAVVISDLYGSIDGEFLQPNLKFGGMYHMPFAGGNLLKRWDIGIEMIDMFNREGVSHLQHINMGSEISILAGFLCLRGGFHQGYPTYGLGARLGVVRLDVAKFTRELGNAPGQNPEERMSAQLSLGW